MKALVRRRLGLCILVALSIPFGVVFFMGTIYAQGFRRPPLRPPPFQPQRPPIVQPKQPLTPRIPQINTPKFEWVWKCTRCQGELGRGQVKPTLTQCPHCGARLIGSTGLESFKPPMTQPQQPAFKPPVTQPQQPAFRPPQQPNFNPQVVNNNQPAPNNPNAQPQTLATSGTESTSSGEADGSISAGVIVVIVVSVVVLLAGIGVAIFVKLTDSSGTRDDLRDPYRKNKSFPGREVI